MAREIKYRQFLNATEINGTKLKGCFHYWGYIYPENSEACVMPLSSTRAKPSQQYTGLKDKNGTEIYEGDIIRVKTKSWHDDPMSYLLLVEWLPRACGFTHKVIDKGGDAENISNFAPEVWSRAGEIIGNIYENPELIGGK